MILIDALYINTGGAKVILEAIIFQLNKERQLSEFFFLIDDRLSCESYSTLKKNNYFVINSSLRNRKQFYINNANLFKKIICLANVPPPINIKNGQVCILFHNAHIIQPNLNFYNFFHLLKYKLKWLYLLYKNKPSYYWIVQTNTMFDLVNKALFVNESKIKILPFFNEVSHVNIDHVKNHKIKCFAYIADGQPQKNHLFLLEAWKILYEKYNIKFKLTLTVSDAYPSLLIKIDKLRNAGLNIENLGLIPHTNVLNLYTKIDYLIYPSLIESFGLPLIEATSNGCDIIAIDKKYVSDVVNPSRSFSEYRVADLVEIIIDISKGVFLPKSQILIKNRLDDFIDLIS